MTEFVDPDRGDWRQQEVNEQQRYERKRMGLMVSDKGSDFESAPVGNHLARCIRVVDLGTQKGEWKGKPKLSRKGYIGWELLGAQRMEDGRPFIVLKWYTLSLSERAQLRADLESWRGLAFTAADLEGFDLSKLLGKPCMLNLIKSDDGKYTNIKSIAQLPAGIVCPESENKPYMFSLDEFDETVFDQLSDNIKETVRQSPEYQKLMGKTPEHVPTGDQYEDETPF
jgi:hypothetical protein